MRLATYRRSVNLPVAQNQAFTWHARPGAFQRLSPPWQRVEIVREAATLEDGAEAELRVKIGPIWRRWLARHEGYVPGVEFTDVQVKGPFGAWRHRHRVDGAEDGTADLLDEITYAPPLGFLGRLLLSGRIRKDLAQLFTYRHHTTRRDLSLHAQTLGDSPMKILVTGASGMIGTQLCAFLSGGGHEIHRLSRSEPKSDRDIQWDPNTGMLPADRLEGFDAVIHLAGENVGAGRWNDAKKQRILESRKLGTTLLADTLAGLTAKPKVLISASAVGIYGDREDETLTEASEPGEGFLAEVCKVWERATRPASAAGIRVATLRFGVVLTAVGGALKKMLLPFKMGVGGKIGSGKQWMPWVSIDDVIGAVHHVLLRDDIAGPVNVVAPTPITNKEFTRALGSVLWRPTILPMPSFMARLAFGEMADALLIASAKVRPTRLEETGYEFMHATIEDCLRRQLGRIKAAA